MCFAWFYVIDNHLVDPSSLFCFAKDSVEGLFSLASFPPSSLPDWVPEYAFSRPHAPVAFHTFLSFPETQRYIDPPESSFLKAIGYFRLFPSCYSNPKA